VTIAVLVFDKSLSNQPSNEAEKQVQRYMDMSRVVGCAMWSLWDVEDLVGDPVFAGIMPHKTFSIGDKTLLHYRSNREALVFVRGASKDETSCW